MMPRVFQVHGQFGELFSNLPCHLLGSFGWVQTVRVYPDGPEYIGMLVEMLEMESVLLIVRVRTVRPAAIEAGVQVEAVADVGHDHEWWWRINCSGVSKRLPHGLVHGGTPTGCVSPRCP